MQFLAAQAAPAAEEATVSPIFYLITLALIVIFVSLYMGGKKYAPYIEPLDKDTYPLCKLYGVGFRIAEILKFNYGSKKERDRRKQLSLIYEDKHAEYYLHVNVAERFTLAYVVLLLGFLFYLVTKKIGILVVFLIITGVVYYYISTQPKEMLTKKTEGLLSDFAEVVSKLALLVNAGMILREAWEKIAFTGESDLYMEMREASFRINNGMSEPDSYAEFGARCMSPEIKKFVSTIIQGQTKGNRELVEMIKQQSSEVWTVQQHRVRQAGEKAASKLLIPIAIMFLGILIIIVVPIFANLF